MCVSRKKSEIFYLVSPLPPQFVPYERRARVEITTEDWLRVVDQGSVSQQSTHTTSMEWSKIYFSVLLSILISSVCSASKLQHARQARQSVMDSLSFDECWELAICDSHARYDDYGLMALPVVLFFPG